MYRNATDVYILVMYPATLLTLTILRWSLYGFHTTISCNLQIVTVLLSNLFAFSFPYLISLDRTSNTMLNRVVRMGILVLFLNLELSAFHS